MKFETILKLSQENLKNALAKELKDLDYQPTVRKGFLYAEGEIPVLLIAHLDTVHKVPPSIICYSTNKRYILSPTGIGGDDRCGVFMILEIIKKHKCHVLFTEDEEIGAVGAVEFTESEIKPEVNFIVELDRRGFEDCVFYDDFNEEFEEFVNSFGFVTKIGTFSDISEIAPALGISAVNLSSGYFNEHTLQEYIDMSVVNKNIEKVKKLVSSKTSLFKYKGYIYKESGFSEKDFLPIDNGFVVFPDGKVEEGYNYYLDMFDNVYEYDWFKGTLYLTEGEAYSERGVLLKFEGNKFNFEGGEFDDDELFY